MIGELLALDIILSKRQTWQPPCGIYFLFQYDTLVYIGSSRAFYTRMLEHQRKIRFNTYVFLPCKVSEQKELETKYILAYTPLLNGHTPDKKLTAQLLTESEINDRKRAIRKRKAKYRDYILEQHNRKENLQSGESSGDEENA